MRKRVSEIDTNYSIIEQAYQEQTEQSIDLAKTSWQLLEILPFSFIKKSAEQRLTILMHQQQNAEQHIRCDLTMLREQLHDDATESILIYLENYDQLKIASKRLRVKKNRYLRMKYHALIRVLEVLLFKELNDSAWLCRFFQIIDYYCKKDLTYHRIMRKMSELKRHTCHLESYY